MKVESGLKVFLDYEGRFEDGEVFDSSSSDSPLEFIAGTGQVIPGFDNAVLGMEEGDEKEFEIEPKDGYGEMNEELKKEIPKSALPQDKAPEVGMTLVMNAPNGQQIPAKIAEVTDEGVIIDLNHPLAGKKLIFKIKVVKVAPTGVPSAEEEGKSPADTPKGTSTLKGTSEIEEKVEEIMDEEIKEEIKEEVSEKTDKEVTNDEEKSE
jgi:FKBP-type peptidyl-prolyl cis-trans isomerase 2